MAHSFWVVSPTDRNSNIIHYSFFLSFCPFLSSYFCLLHIVKTVSNFMLLRSHNFCSNGYKVLLRVLIHKFVHLGVSRNTNIDLINNIVVLLLQYYIHMLVDVFGLSWGDVIIKQKGSMGFDISSIRCVVILIDCIILVSTV